MLETVALAAAIHQRKPKLPYICMRQALGPPWTETKKPGEDVEVRLLRIGGSVCRRMEGGERALACCRESGGQHEGVGQRLVWAARCIFPM